ncbi:cryptochrome/photolyase family protein [Ancylobacter sp. WKF20]|uniref:cryptochrome/photolyase family protein n=1 Tax=Ancylobacter sp. WKF20 TaxID=3039801 RepID=UPI002434321A|nr:cryptochrome/photolyase family protein [Ancylobacter sp. WKF20]WGD32096.1 cryptochrome/photolyase family protein [Ancylobacter sp. WKF20]
MTRSSPRPLPPAKPGGTLRLVLGDQLSRSLSALDGLDPARDTVLMMEVRAEATHVRHHAQKIALFFSAMRHFAAALEQEGVRVDYIRLDDPSNTQSFAGEITRAVERHAPARVIATEPGEWRVEDALLALREELPIPLEIRPDSRFFATRGDFERWAEGRRSLRMEFFYREMRRAHGLLMEGEAPLGGRWNFDAENREALPKDVLAPAPPRFAPDAITAEVLELVTREFPGHFGTLEGFGWAVTREDALTALDHFIAHALPRFGDYQDAMRAGDPFLFHAILSPYLNVGLLQPREVCAAAERAFHEGAAPLNAVEGFIRQILGWREYVRGIYWLKMPDYAHSNHFNATRPLPRFFWDGQTDLACLAHVVEDTRAHAYAHHIQRLMVIGNFALLAGLDPAAVEEWFLIVYADAVEWVELPNVHGMALFADGGVLGSKPYAASGAYIDRMSDYCASCRYDPKVKSGPKACPFNYLYWDFLDRNRDKLARNPRLAMPYRNLARFDEARRHTFRTDAARFLDGLEPAQAGRDW